MALKKSQLYSHIWDACDELRGGMDASQYKDYVLVLLFVRYVTDKYANQKRGDVVIPEGGSFRDLSKLKGKTSIGDGINKVLAKLAKANNLSGVIDAVDFNDPDKLGSGEEMQDRLTKLVAIFEDPGLDFSKNRAEGDDLLGDAYEYLMKHGIDPQFGARPLRRAVTKYIVNALSMKLLDGSLQEGNKRVKVKFEGEKINIQ